MKNRKWKQYGTMITAAVFLTAAGLTYGFGRRLPDTEENRESSEVVLESLVDTDDLAADPDVLIPETESAVVSIYVHICGEVAKPGVYELSEGSRIVDAVAAAGGLSADAAEEAVNLAKIVTDGMQIVIPNQEEADAAEKQMAELEAGLVNLNTADKEQLMELPGIGASKAEDIIRYRESAGGFRTIEEIMQVPGIKDAGFQKIKDRIIV